MNEFGIEEEQLEKLREAAKSVVESLVVKPQGSVMKTMEEMIASHYRTVFSTMEFLLDFMEENPKWKNRNVLEAMEKYLNKITVQLEGR